MEFIYLSDALTAARGASTLDMSDPEIEKWFMDEVKNAYIDEHKKGNLSFYNNRGACINFAIVKVSEKLGSDELNIAISDDEKDLIVGENYIFPCVMLDIEQLLNLTHERCNKANKELK